MQHEPSTRLVAPGAGLSSSFWDGMLAPRALRALERVEGSRMALERAGFEDALPLFRRAARQLPLASLDDIRRMVAKNPEIIRIARDPLSGDPCALFAYLPLNEFGAGMFVSGQADGGRPDPAWITRPGEAPAALYKWLFFGPDLYMRCLGNIGEIFAALGPACPILTRGATKTSEDLHLKLGYLRASRIYPGAPDWLLVLLPEGTPEGGAHPKAVMEIRQVRSFEELSHVIAIRAATYIAEQFPTHHEEFDGNDFCATHFVGYMDGDPAGAVRVRYFGDFAKLERLAVKLEYRRSRLAFRLARTAMDHIRRKGFSRVYGHASETMAPFWRHHGGRYVEGRPPFRFANIEYREMYCDLEPDPLAIRFGVHPMMTVRPEGLWDEPGSLDWSNVADEPVRSDLMAICSGLRESAKSARPAACAAASLRLNFMEASHA